MDVVGSEDLPIEPILGASFISPGDPFSESALDDAQRAIYGLGAFSSVQVEPQIPEAGCGIPIPVRVEVSPGRRLRFGVGGGVQSGTLQTSTGQEDVRQWDVHLLGVVEHRNLFGGMRKLRIEERPRYVFNETFPTPEDPQFGNQLTAEFRQPAFLEARTTLVVGGRYDWGPEPFGNRFLRHDVDARIALERNFLDGQVFLSGGLHGNLFRVIGSRNDLAPLTVRDDLRIDSSSYHVTFWEQYAQLDLRDDPRQPRRGAFFGLTLHEAGFGLPASWDYVRAAPEARGYIPLPLDIVLAFRLSVAAIFVVNADSGLDVNSEDLGPEQYRLRGGGASSNRGFLPGDLGAGIQGGKRRWEASIELRISVSEDFGFVLFSDAGDVNDDAAFRFNHPHPAVGVGLRYNTVVGPVRFDMAGLLPGIQVIGAPDPDPKTEVNLGFASFPGAWHLTIGESF
jgi:hypothetical protein